MGIAFEISAKEIGSKTNWSLEADTSGIKTYERTIELVEATLISIAESVLKEEQDAGRFPKRNFVEITDGVINKPYQEVSLAKKGSIEFATPANLKDIVTFLYTKVRELSPVESGDYFNSHILIFNGKEVADNQTEAIRWASTAQIREKDTLRIMNVQPYARKLERFAVTSTNRKRRIGKASKRETKETGRLKVLKPNGVYYLAEKLVKKNFGDAIGRVKFDWVFGNALIAQKAGKPGKYTFLSPGRGQGRPYLYPSIFLMFNVNGIK